MSDTSRSSALAALRHRNIRLLWLGQLVSMAGSMMQSAAMLWHASIMFPAAAVAGPALAGLVIAVGRVGWAYAFDAASFLCVIGALLAMRDVPGRPEGTTAKVDFRSALESLRFVIGAPLIRSTMLLGYFETFFASATALLPVFAQDVLHVGAHGYGWLAAAPTVGAILASLVMVRAIHLIERCGLVLL